MKNSKKEQSERAAKNAQAILAYIKGNPNSTASEAAKKLGIAFIQVHQISQKLVTEGKLSVNNKMYSLAVAPAAKNAVKAKPEQLPKNRKSPKPQITEDDNESPENKNFGRDFSKLEFDGKELRKGKYVLAVMQAFIKDNPKMTMSKLESLFPKKLVRSFGLFEEAAKARKVNAKGKQRYFGRMGQIINLADKKISVTNQISKENLPSIIDAFKAAGARVQ